MGALYYSAELISNDFFFFSQEKGKGRNDIRWAHGIDFVVQI